MSYEAMREYEKRTGEPAYTQVSGGVNFKDYFENHMTAQQQKFVSVAYADCIGEMTTGKYGGGHTVAYYRAKNRSSMRYCESIANIKLIKKYSKNIGEPFDFLNTADMLKIIGE